MDSDITIRLENYRKEVFKLELQLETKKQQANDFIDRLYEANRINEDEYKSLKERYKLEG